MSTSTQNHTEQHIKYEFTNWVASEPLERDQTQSSRLHEPTHRNGTIDPMTGHDVTELNTHTSVDDGDLTVYFESEETRRQYMNMPVDHPNLELPFPPSDDDDRGG